MANLDELKDLLGKSTQQIKDGRDGLSEGKQQASGLQAGFKEFGLTGSTERTQPLIDSRESVLAKRNEVADAVEEAVGHVHRIQA